MKTTTMSVVMLILSAAAVRSVIAYRHGDAEAARRYFVAQPVTAPVAGPLPAAVDQFLQGHWGAIRTAPLVRKAINGNIHQIAYNQLATCWLEVKA
jgi:hypothetical protein